MKITIVYLSILILVVSCKGKITDIKITPTNSYKKYKSFITYKEFPDDENKENSAFLYVPISFKLDNNTGRSLRISHLWNNFHSTSYSPSIINNKYYNKSEDKVGNIKLEAGDSLDIIIFANFPIPIKLLDKTYSTRYLDMFKNRKTDSIVLTEINFNLQKSIDSLLKKKDITILLRETKNKDKKVMIVYCANQQKIITYNMDSIAKVNPNTDFKCICNKLL